MPRVALKAGEKTTPRFTLTPRSLQYYDVYAHRWADTPGVHRIIIGSFSRDAHASQEFELAAAL